jgi:hypothetical protein
MRRGTVGIFDEGVRGRCDDDDDDDDDDDNDGGML